MKTATQTAKAETEHVSRSLLQRSQKEGFFSTRQHQAEPFFGPASLQTKLEIGQPNDPYEREADKVADQVMRMPDAGVQMKCTSCEDEERIRQKPLIQRAVTGSNSAFSVSPEIASKISSTRGSGNPLPKNTQNEMGGKIGADFSGVKIHTDNKAVQLSQELGAKAFTVGNNVYFNQGQYNPNSGDGKRLMAHELAHVVQQTSAKSIIQRSSEQSSTGSDGTDLGSVHLPTFYFRFDSTSMIQGSDGTAPNVALEKLLVFAQRFVDEYPSGRIILSGYASEEGDTNYNFQLSQWRAEQIMRYLVEEDISFDQIVIEPRGEDTRYPTRAENRRVEIRTNPVLLPEERFVVLTEEEERLRICGVRILAYLGQWSGPGGVADLLFEAAYDRAGAFGGIGEFMEFDPWSGSEFVAARNQFCKDFPEVGSCDRILRQQETRLEEARSSAREQFWKEFEQLVQEQGIPEDDLNCFDFVFDRMELPNGGENPVTVEVGRRISRMYYSHAQRMEMASTLVEQAQEEEGSGFNFFYTEPTLTYREAKRKVDAWWLQNVPLSR